ncbi:unnamed protein product [Prorocentrum cordatum]|uniref:Uncharacterized protein n=1 Tax=Prorocentrum cordatum TaxID=2364126 RepID=A0ABN9PV63_9DINO|nr:unnamed protein product [Polarella glacialis]
MAVLEAAPIQRRTRNRHQEILRNFLARSNGRPPAAEGQVGVAIAEWLGVLRLDGEDLRAGSWAFATVTLFAGLNGASGARMPRCRHALRGFRRLAPPRSRLPMPYMVEARAVMELLARRRVKSALAVPTTFALYLRAGGALHIRAVDLGPPVSDVGALAAVTSDFKIDVEARGARAALGAALMCTRRRGGAAHDYASGYRRLEDARRLGRWRQRLAQVAPYLTPALKAHGELCMELLSARVFAVVFSGGGRLSDAISGAGVTALLWDISLGDNYDLRCRRNRHLLVGWVRGGLVVGVHVSTPCPSFSRARDIPPGPPRLRSDSEPMGLGGLSQADQEKVAIGNIMFLFGVYYT